MSRNGKITPMDELLSVMAALRTPQTGCPWDLEQTFETIAPYTVEEAYEVADAIERGDTVDLRDELGDLLLQVVYHARIAEEQGLFVFDDVVTAIKNKMIRRHPHVFGTAQERAAGAEPGFWETIKVSERQARTAERAARGLPPKTADQGVLSDVPRNLPALTRALKLQNKAAQAGFDWPTLAPVLAKMREELAELDEALSNGGTVSNPTSDQAQHPQTAEIREELGDLLFVMANVARHLSIDAETCLHQSNAKFERRFRGIERHLAARGRDIQEATLEEMDEIWDEIKRQEKA